MGKKNSSLSVAGVVLLIIAGLLTVVLLSTNLNLQELAFVKVGIDGVTVGGLSEENAMWFGGFLAILYLVGSGMVVKSRN